jgi:hypothetical protein
VIHIGLRGHLRGWIADHACLAALATPLRGRAVAHGVVGERVGVDRPRFTCLWIASRRPNVGATRGRDEHEECVAECLHCGVVPFERLRVGQWLVWFLKADGIARATVADKNGRAEWALAEKVGSALRRRKLSSLLLCLFVERCAPVRGKQKEKKREAFQHLVECSRTIRFAKLR